MSACFNQIQFDFVVIYLKLKNMLTKLKRRWYLCLKVSRNKIIWELIENWFCILNTPLLYLVHWCQKTFPLKLQHKSQGELRWFYIMKYIVGLFRYLKFTIMLLHSTSMTKWLTWYDLVRETKNQVWPVSKLIF